ncbi:hypothetical protein CDAR_31831 [Caerostris darwini]|uniref:Uncharacterized protein n=1 Tax=Caerostris darwini TaxID=1538125 RepID=A0AAV4S8R3_9ARAC|nr:hypothetical protein CDAR_31831 [Caerostris darwini]
MNILANPGIKQQIPLKTSNTTTSVVYQDKIECSRDIPPPVLPLPRTPKYIDVGAFLLCSFPASCQSLPRSQITQQAATSDSTSQVLGLQLEDSTSHAREPTLEGDLITDSLSREVVREV